jgi:hypothetical protein
MTRSSMGCIRLSLLTLATAFVALAGCDRAPTAPGADGGAESETLNSPQVLVIAGDGRVSYTDAAPLESQEEHLERRGSSLHASKQIDGSRGGWVRCGRLSLRVTPGAFDGVGTITMSMKDSTAMLVDLEIQPARLNDFKAPVVLAINTTGADVATDSLSLYWFNPQAKSWVALSTATTLAGANESADVLEGVRGHQAAPGVGTDGLSTTLSHFSRYSAGRAARAGKVGW